MKCKILYRRFDSHMFERSEDMVRTLSGSKDLSLALIIEDVYQRYLRNDAADFLLSGNDPALVQRIAGSAMLLRRKDDGGIVSCSAANVVEALRKAYSFDVGKGVILKPN